MAYRIDDATNQGATDIKDAAVRILLSCASTPEQYWHHVVQTIIHMPYARVFRIFHYVIHQFLRATSNFVYEDWFELPADTVTFLRRLDANARARSSEVTNPIDRFIMMARQITAVRSRHALTLQDAGMQTLLEVVLSGRYDKFFIINDDGLSIAPTREEESDSLLSPSSVDSPVTFSDCFTVRRAPVDVRTGVCTSMARELKEAAARAKAQSVSSPTPILNHVRMYRPLPKIPDDAK